MNLMLTTNSWMCGPIKTTITHDSQKIIYIKLDDRSQWIVKLQSNFTVFSYTKETFAIALPTYAHHNRPNRQLTIEKIIQ